MATSTSTLLFLLTTLALASGMVLVLMFGMSNMHNTIDTVQASIEKHERALRSSQQADKGLTEQVNEGVSRVASLEKRLEKRFQEQNVAMSTADHSHETKRATLVQRIDELSSALAAAEKKSSEDFGGAQRKLQAEESLRETAATQLEDLRRTVDYIKFQQQEAQQEAQRLADKHRSLEDAVANLTRTLASGMAKAAQANAPTPAPTAAGSTEGVKEETSTKLVAAVEGSPGRLLKLPSAGQRSTASPGGATAAPAPSSSSSSSSGEYAHYRVSWYRECGCTGMEIEAVTLLTALVARIGAARVLSNKCAETCEWSRTTRVLLDEIEVEQESDLWPLSAEQWPKTGERWVLVVHAAFNGVCGVPDNLGFPSAGGDDEQQEERSSDAHHGLFRVSRSMFETDRLDQEAVSRCNTHFDAVWVPSGFNLRTFSDSGVKKELIHTLPEALGSEEFRCSAAAEAGEAPPAQREHPAKFGIKRLDAFVQEAVDNSTFTFLSVFKWEERKNWRQLLETFWRSFPHRVTLVGMEDESLANVTVRLLIKTQELSWGSNPQEDLADLFGALGAREEDAKGRVLVVKERFQADLMPDLYKAADAFVLPSHGEGWGLPVMEAMASGLPTIATGWGGQTEFLNSGNAWPLGYRLVSAGGEGSDLWAEPDASELRAAMWEVVKRTSSARQRAARACRDVPARFNPAAVARLADGLLGGLGAAAGRASSGGGASQRQ